MAIELVHVGPTHEAVPEPNTYSVYVNIMHGDADYYESFTIDDFRADSVEDMELLHNLLNLLEALKDRNNYPYSESRTDFSPWFSGEIAEEDDALGKRVEAFYARTNYYPDWPCDACCYMEGTLDEYKVTYYDADSETYKVAVNFIND